MFSDVYFIYRTHYVVLCFLLIYCGGILDKFLSVS